MQLKARDLFRAFLILQIFDRLGNKKTRPTLSDGLFALTE